jgi:hypothetical protein
MPFAADGLQRLSIVAALLLLAACTTTSAPQPESMRDPQVDFGAFRTYGWQPAPQVDGKDAPVALLDQNIRAAIATELNKRGYVEAANDPDLQIAYETASADKIENNPVRVGVGVGSWGGSMGGSIGVGTPSISNYREGTLVVHAIERARNAEVWQGRISGKLSKGSIEAAAVQRAVALAMRDFPARTAPAPQAP